MAQSSCKRDTEIKKSFRGESRAGASFNSHVNTPLTNEYLAKL